tara:strand:- start:367 stop:531 length:165 start_codon:yes stop_codon:yes gene_type:complete
MDKEFKKLFEDKEFKKLFKDYEGDLLNFFAGLSPQASKKFNKKERERKLKIKKK